MDPVQRAKKRFNRFLLDNQGSYPLGICVVLLLLVSIYILFSSDNGASYEIEIAMMTSEIDALREIFDTEQRERHALQDELTRLEMERYRIEEQIKSQSQILMAKNATAFDLVNGLRTLGMDPSFTFVQVNIPDDIVATTTSADIAKRDAVKQAMKFAWDSYKEICWGKDELRPVSKTFQNWLNLGLTIVDSLDTLWIMGLYDDFALARDWVAKHLEFEGRGLVSTFETTIRVLGGLLPAYEFSKDQVFLEKAEDLAQRLLKSFTESGMPRSQVDLTKGTSAGSDVAVLSEIGTLQLEFLYLAYHTGKPEYSELPMNAFKALDRIRPENGLYPLAISTKTGNGVGAEYSLGALGDSFYEYMLKLWLITDKQANGYKRMYAESAQGIKKHLVRSTPSGFRYVGKSSNGRFEEKMEHLTCFSGGMFALGAAENIVSDPIDDLLLGGDITATCHESYDKTPNKLGPEVFNMAANREFTPGGPSYYILRPETVESYFILWRTTKDERYRQWAWEAFQAIEKNCKTGSGYSGIRDVFRSPGQHDDLQQTFMLAETLKYLYLIFSDDSVIPLDEYVFNTEAHPLGIFKKSLDDWPLSLRVQLMEI